MALFSGKNSNTYKKGKLSRGGRFSKKKTNPAPFIIILCVLLSFVFAMILGNYLGDKAQDSQNTTTNPGGASSIVTPTPDKVSPLVSLNAYLADMTGADPEESLSNQTAAARDKGNALLIDLRDGEGKLIYTSDATESLSYPARENLTLDRLKNHFDYYADTAVAYFRSDFSHNLSPSKRLSVQSDEISILSEASSVAFSQIIVEFSEPLTRSNLIYYQTYLINLKLACPNIPVGITLGYSYLTDSDNSGSIAELMKIADFYALDIGDTAAEELADTLSPLIYISTRYGSVILLDEGDAETLSERIAILSDKGFKNYAVR